MEGNLWTFDPTEDRNRLQLDGLGKAQSIQEPVYDNPKVKGVQCKIFRRVRPRRSGSTLKFCSKRPDVPPSGGCTPGLVFLDVDPGSVGKFLQTNCRMSRNREAAQVEALYREAYDGSSTSCSGALTSDRFTAQTKRRRRTNTSKVHQNLVTNGEESL